MSDELKSILSEIAFPVRYVRESFRDGDVAEIIDNVEMRIVDLSTSFYSNDAFGHELARLINTLDPKRESVSDKEISGLKT